MVTMMIVLNADNIVNYCFLRKHLTDKDKSTLHTIKQKQSQNHLTFVKADKGNCTVIMKTDELQEKAYTFF